MAKVSRSVWRRSTPCLAACALIIVRVSGSRSPSGSGARSDSVAFHHCRMPPSVCTRPCVSTSSSGPERGRNPVDTEVTRCATTAAWYTASSAARAASMGSPQGSSSSSWCRIATLLLSATTSSTGQHAMASAARAWSWRVAVSALDRRMPCTSMACCFTMSRASAKEIWAESPVLLERPPPLGLPLADGQPPASPWPRPPVSAGAGAVGTSMPASRMRLRRQLMRLGALAQGSSSPSDEDQSSCPSDEDQSSLVLVLVIFFLTAFLAAFFLRCHHFLISFTLSLIASVSTSALDASGRSVRPVCAAPTSLSMSSPRLLVGLTCCGTKTGS